MMSGERLTWPVEQLHVQPGDRLLEVGCGHGVAVSLVCEHLDGGQITAIDRSRKMIDMAIERNAQHVAAGRARLEVTSIEGADLGGERFHKLFSVNVNSFWRKPDQAAQIAAGLLRDGGMAFFFGQSLSDDPEPAMRAHAAPLAAALDRGGFERVAVTTTTAGHVFVCVSAVGR
jgi:cyclopropane fatty-acyl-phospholipid synthase-like methyltransferase